MLKLSGRARNTVQCVTCYSVTNGAPFAKVIYDWPLIKGLGQGMPLAKVLKRKWLKVAGSLSIHFRVLARKGFHSCS